jgi:hypothetical protein
MEATMDQWANDAPASDYEPPRLIQQGSLTELTLGVQPVSPGGSDPWGGGGGGPWDA